MPPKPFTIVFDYDDTLTIDTERRKKGLFVDVFDNIAGARDIAQAFVSGHPGMPRLQMLEGVLQDLASRGLVADPAALLEVYLLRFSQMAEDMAVTADLRPGAIEVLQKLASHHRLYLNSANPHAALQNIVERRGWNQFFVGAYGSPPGSKDEHLRTIMDREQADPSRTIVIGDGGSDLAAAEQCRCHFIGVQGEFSAFRQGEFPIVQELPQILPIIEAL